MPKNVNYRWLALHPPDVVEPAVRFDVGAVFDDDALLLVNKPPNLMCHPLHAPMPGDMHALIHTGQ